MLVSEVGDSYINENVEVVEEDAVILKWYYVLEIRQQKE